MPETSHAPLPPADTLSAALAATLAARLGTAFLGEEETPEPEALAQAAHFLREAAASRAPGLPALAIEPFLTATGQRLTRIAVINDDMPFLVDTIAGAVSTEGLAIERLAHPVLAAERDGAGRLADILAQLRPHENDDGGLAHAGSFPAPASLIALANSSKSSGAAKSR